MGNSATSKVIGEGTI